MNKQNFQHLLNTTQYQAYCEACGSRDLHTFFELADMPTQDGAMCNTREAALNCLKGDISLQLCQQCGFVFNASHDAAQVQFDDYDFSLNFSPSFVEFTHQLIDRLNHEYQLKGKKVIEVGCGDGYFIGEMCKRTGCEGIGMDPGFELDAIKVEPGLNLSFIRDYYSEKYIHLNADFLICRLVIDILEDTMGFVKTVRKSLEGNWDAVVYFEVPNALKNFEQQVVWNLVYEHRCWFTPDSLAYYFEACGFRVLNSSPCWHEEFLGIEAMPIPWNEVNPQVNESSVRGLQKTIREFELRVAEIRAEARERLAQIRREGSRAVMWGAGARALMFLNMNETRDLIPYLVDINPLRWGKFMPGTGHEIIPPQKLKEVKPDLIIINNPIYANEIREQVELMGLDCAYWVF